MPQVDLGPVAPILGLPISHVDDEAKTDDKSVNGKTEVYDTSDEKGSVKVYNAALATDDEDKNSEDSSDVNGDYDKSYDDNGDNESNDSESNDDGDNGKDDYSKVYSKDYGKDYGKDDGDDGDDNGGNDDNNSGPSPQVSNAPVGGVETGDGSTSPAGYVIGALALAGMGGAAAVTARRSSRRRMGRHEA